MIALIFPGRNQSDEAALAFSLTQAVAGKNGKAVLFTDNLPKGRQLSAVLLKTFHLCVAGTIRPVDVYYAEQNAAGVFIIENAEPTVFAAAVAAAVGHLVDTRGEKPHCMHLFWPEDIFAALLCKKYFQIPFVYSHRQYREVTLPKKHLLALGLNLPENCPGFGDFFFPEHLAGLEAAHVIDENAGTVPRDWSCLLSSFTGRVIQGRPVVEAAYWSDEAEGSRADRKKRETAERGLDGDILILTATAAAIDKQMLPPEAALFPLDKEDVNKKVLLQAADFYLCHSEDGLPAHLLQAMAAGCIPVAAKTGFAAHMLVSVKEEANGGCGYFYNSGETWQEALQAAIEDFRKSPDRHVMLRERNKAWVAEQFTPPQAAGLYHRTYHGLGPVRLPFVAARKISVSSETEE